MSERLDELGGPEGVALVTFTTPEHLDPYRSRHELPFPILVDPDRRTYRAYGLGRGSIGRVYGWRAARRYAAIVAADGPGGLRRPVEDTRQLGGDFVVAPDGTLAWGYWGAGPDDRPPIDDLVAAYRRSAAG